MRHQVLWIFVLGLLLLGEGSLFSRDAKLPEGFTVLLGAKDLAGWKEAKGKDGHWKVENGVLAYDGKGSNLSTEKEYSNFILHIDWKINKGGDSGIFPRGVAQIQIWDNKEGSGGIWPKNKPLKNADNKPGEWNRFEITVEKGLVSVKLNNDLVVDKYDMQFKKSKGPIVLQHHGNPLWFKNIYIKELPD
jgi:hypothetical protein